MRDFDAQSALVSTGAHTQTPSLLRQKYHSMVANPPTQLSLLRDLLRLSGVPRGSSAALSAAIARLSAAAAPAADSASASSSSSLDAAAALGGAAAAPFDVDAAQRGGSYRIEPETFHAPFGSLAGCSDGDAEAAPLAAATDGRGAGAWHEGRTRDGSDTVSTGRGSSSGGSSSSDASELSDAADRDGDALEDPGPRSYAVVRQHVAALVAQHRLI